MGNILTHDQIKNIKNLNGDAIKFYLKLAEDRLLDTLETKKQYDQKAYTFLGGYIAAALALFGLSVNYPVVGVWLNITAVIFCIGVIPVFLSLKASEYGNIGRNPRDWLHTNAYLSVKEDRTSLMYAYHLRDLVPRIDQSKLSNEKKATRLNIAILFGISALLPFSIKFLFSL